MKNPFSALFNLGRRFVNWIVGAPAKQEKASLNTVKMVQEPVQKNRKKGLAYAAEWNKQFEGKDDLPAFYKPVLDPEDVLVRRPFPIEDIDSYCFIFPKQGMN